MGTLTRLQIENGDIGEAEASIEAAKNEPSRHSWKAYYLHVLFAEAELAIYRGQHQRALETTDDLINRLYQYGMRSRLAEAEYLKAITLVELKQHEAARDCYMQSRALAEEVGSRRILWRTLCAHSQLESEQDKSEELRQGARRVIEDIVSHIHQEDLKDSFLNRSEIKSVLKDR